MARPVLIPYLRKSSKEDPADSRKRQRRAIDAWAAANGVELALEVFEPGVSGSRAWRERRLGDALAICERGEADGIIVEDLSRLLRGNGLQRAEIWDAFQKADIRLVSVADGIDTANGDHELNFTLRAAIARENWKDYARRMDAVKRTKVLEKGIHISGTVPFGYKRGPDKVLVRKPGEAEAVAAAFELRTQGLGLDAIRAELDLHFPGGPSGNGAWTKQTLARMLANRVYVGEARQGKYVKPGAHEALVDGPTFDTVQAIAAHRSEPHAAPQTTVTLLPGLVRCSGCGYAMVRTKIGKATVYRCRGENAAGKCPKRQTIMQEALDAHVWQAFLDRVQTRGIAAESHVTTAELDELHARIAAARTKRANFADPDVLERLGHEAWSRGLDKVDAELAELERELADKVETRNGGGDFPVDLPNVDELGLDERRELLVAGIDAIIVSPGTLTGWAARRAGPAERVDIRWKGDAPPIARPSKHRPKVEAGISAA